MTLPILSFVLFLLTAAAVGGIIGYAVCEAVNHERWARRMGWRK